MVNLYSGHMLLIAPYDQLQMMELLVDDVSEPSVQAWWRKTTYMGCIDAGAGNGKIHYTCMVTLIQ